MLFRSPPLTRIALGIALFLGASSLLSAQTPPKGCVTDTHTLCLDQGRFAVTVTFQETPTGFSQDAHAVQITDQTGNFWFFDPSNVEVVVKILNGCAGFDSFWFFAAGLTNLGVTIEVRDLVTDMQKNYSSTFGEPFQPIQDTSAFRTCP